jgi:hypothetical protein
MILTHQKVDFGDKCLIEKIIIQAPWKKRQGRRSQFKHRLYNSLPRSKGTCKRSFSESAPGRRYFTL